MTDPEIIIKVINFLGISKRRFALEIGFKTADTVYNIINKKHGITRKTAKMITTRYSNISYDFLITGKGDVTITGEMPKEDLDLQVRIYKLESQCQRYEGIIDTLTKSLDTQIIVKKLEQKCEEILKGTINKNAEKLNSRIDEIEERLLKNIKSNV